MEYKVRLECKLLEKMTNVINMVLNSGLSEEKQIKILNHISKKIDNILADVNLIYDLLDKNKV